MSRQTLNTPSRPYSVTQLSPSASLAHALKIHWRGDLMDAVELPVLFIRSFLFFTPPHCPPDSRTALSSCRCLLRHYNARTIWQLHRVRCGVRPVGIAHGSGPLRY